MNSRRSGSLPSLSRVSMGRPSIGCGPQRVACGVSVDANVTKQSGGGFGSTTKRFGSVSAVNQSSVTKQSRMSLAGASSSVSAVKDARPFSDKLYRERMVRELVEFLSAHGYPHAISLKGANGPSSGDFKKIFEFMVGYLQPDYKLNDKLELEVPRVLKAHGYPITITNSHMRTIGVPSTWVVLLAALSYLRTIIDVTESVDVDEILFCSDENEPGTMSKIQIYHEYVKNCYQNFLAGNDDEVVKLRDVFMQNMENAAIPLSEIQALEDDVKHSMDMLTALQSAPNEAGKLSDEVAVLEVDATKMTRFVSDLERYSSDLENQLRASEVQLAAKVAEKTELELDIQRKNKILSEQRISGCDAQRINGERKALKAKLAVAEKELTDLEHQLEAAEEQYQAEQDAVNVAVGKFNSKARLLQLIPPTAEFAEGKDLEMRALLTDEESSRFETVVRPALHVIIRQQMEKCRQSEEQLKQTIEGLSHFNDVVSQYRDELTSLTNAITSIDVAIEQSKQTHMQEIEKLQTSIDELNNKIMNRRQKGAVESARRHLKEIQESSEQEKSKLLNEENRASQELIELCNAAVLHRDNVKKMLQLQLEELIEFEKEVERDIEMVSREK